MDKLWQRFVSTFGDAQIAALALLIVGMAVVVSAALLARWIKHGCYSDALGFAVGLVCMDAICVRDYRGGRWRVLSLALVIIWMLLTVAALAFGIWMAVKQS